MAKAVNFAYGENVLLLHRKISNAHQQSKNMVQNGGERLLFYTGADIRELG
jgi:hypothetical protein